jgi:RNA polymerase sigma factor (sigma-70 family)
VNDAIKAAHRQKRSISLDEQLELDGPAVRLAAQLVDPTFQPAQIVEEKETRQLILNAIKSLAPEQRAVIVMRYFLDLSEADLSAKMERPLSTIKWWLRDARKRLHDLMESRMEGE